MTEKYQVSVVAATGSLPGVQPRSADRDTVKPRRPGAGAVRALQVRRAGQHLGLDGALQARAGVLGAGAAEARLRQADPAAGGPAVPVRPGGPAVRQGVREPRTDERRQSPFRRRPRRRARATAGRHRIFPIPMVAPALVLLRAARRLPDRRSRCISASATWDGIGCGHLPWRWATTGGCINDSLVRQSIVTSLVFFAGTVAFTVMFATLLANAISRKVPGARVFKTVWFLPVIVPVSAAGVFWSNPFQPSTGVANSVLGALGLGDGHAWLASSSTALIRDDLRRGVDADRIRDADPAGRDGHHSPTRSTRRPRSMACPRPDGFSGSRCRTSCR